MLVYLDNSATTKPCDEAINAALLSMKDSWGNPSSLHFSGLEASSVLEKSRASVARSLSCSEEEIVFTSGGTQSNNIAVLGAANSLKRRGSRIITTSIEHASVSEPVKYLESQGFDVIRLRVNENGLIDERQLYAATNPSVVLISIMYVNNEVGTVQPVEFAKRAAVHCGANALIHCDAVQAFGKLRLKPYNIGVDLMSISAHKIHGIKGAGALFIKKGTRLSPTVFGGLQEKKIRPGTQGMPAIAAFGAAVDSLPDFESNYGYISQLRDYLVSELKKLDFVLINSPVNALPYITNISVPGIPSEVMMNFLSERGICVSNGSACSKGKRSEVLGAMGFDNARIDSSLRLSISRFTRMEEIDYFVHSLSEAFAQIRKVRG